MIKPKKQYSSFREIDAELEMLKLEAAIEKERLKKSYFNFKESVSPIQITTSLIGNLVQKAFWAKLLQKVLPFSR